MLFAGKGRELVILRGQAGVKEWEALQQGGGAGAVKGEGEGGARHVLRYRVVRNPPGITELRFAAKCVRLLACFEQTRSGLAMGMLGQSSASPCHATHIHIG